MLLAASLFVIIWRSCTKNSSAINQSAVYIRRTMSERPNPSASISTLNRIESLVMGFLEQLASQTESEDNANASRRKILLELVNRLKPTSTKCLTYPRKAISGSARPFAQLFRLLDLSHEAIIANEPLTKR